MNKLAKATISLMCITALSKILGFGREVVLGSIYGATLYSDIYLTAVNIPTVLFSSIGTAISTTFIPLYYENKNIGGKNEALKFTNNVLNMVILAGMLLVILSIIFTEPLVKIFAMGFEGEKLKLTVDFTRIMLFGGLVTILSNIIAAYMQINENFIIPGLIGLPFNIIIIISIIASKKYSIYIIAVGTLLAMISQLLFQIPFALHKGYRYKTVLNIKDKYIKKMIWLIAPVFIGIGVNQINVLVDRTLASTLVEGSISALNYANRLNGFVMGLFITSIGAVVYPMLSKLSSDNNIDKFNESIIKSINIVVLFIVPISVGAIVLSKPIIQILFERGAFDSRATNMTAIALIFYSIGMVAFGLRDILGKIFYSLQDTKTPMINGIISVCLNIVLNLILVKVMSYAGLALATSISSIVCIFLLFISLKKKIKDFKQNKIISVTLKSLISAIIMGIVVKFTYVNMNLILGSNKIFDLVSLISSIGVGFIVYSIFIIGFKIEEVNTVLEIIKLKTNKKVEKY